MTIVHRIASPRLRRAGLLALICSCAPAMAEPPKRPARLPQVGATASAKDVRETGTLAAHTVDAKSGYSLSSQQVKARAAAMKISVPMTSHASQVRATTNRSASPGAAVSAAGGRRWLPTTTSDSRFEDARKKLSEAAQSYEVGAWLTAESSAWAALQDAAEAIDLSHRNAGANVTANETATARLRVARRAILEARDFSRWSDPQDSGAIDRTARSHQTEILHGADTSGLTAIDATDRYLDFARFTMAPLASESVEVARGLDLLAAILLTRNEAKQLPGRTALCLRRAALQGQPQNASLAFRLGAHLADVGLWNEAEWALQHSLQLCPAEATASALASVLRRTGRSDRAQQILAAYRPQLRGTPSAQAPRIPQITQLSPEQFAAASPPVMNGQPVGSAAPSFTLGKSETNAKVASEKQSDAEISMIPASVSTTADEEKQPGRIRRFFGSLRSVW